MTEIIAIAALSLFAAYSGFQVYGDLTQPTKKRIKRRLRKMLPSVVRKA